MNILTFLVNYWSQITLLLFGAGFFIQKIFEQRLKKAESRHTIFQESKLETVMKFLSAYTKSERLWHTIPHGKIINREFTALEVDNMIVPTLNELIISKNELTLFFNVSDMANFEEIVDSVIRINNSLQMLYFSSDKIKNPVEKSNDFHLVRNNLFKDNTQTINKIGVLVRQMYNS